MKNSRFDIYELFPALRQHGRGKWYAAPKQASATKKGPGRKHAQGKSSHKNPFSDLVDLSDAIR